MVSLEGSEAPVLLQLLKQMSIVKEASITQPCAIVTGGVYFIHLGHLYFFL